MKVDNFRTPAHVAEDMLSAVRFEQFDLLADFAAGDGALLAFAKKLWPRAKVLAIDVRHGAISRLKSRYPGWSLACGDFLNGLPRRSVGPLGRLLGRKTLALLNPPFSCRGGTFCSVAFYGAEIRCGLALAFVLQASTMLSPESDIVAVLPSGSLRSQKDQAAWAVLREQFVVKVLNQYGRFTFKNCFPRTVIVHFGSRTRHTDDAAPGEQVVNGSEYREPLIRGWVQMHTRHSRVGRRLLPLLHSTDLRDGKVGCSNQRVRSDRKLDGFAVLVPRVGQPRKDKIVVWGARRAVALSDCVIAIPCADLVQAELLRDAICGRWHDLDQCYCGTGARCITLVRLRIFLGIITDHGLVNVNRSLAA
jgi:hypothetical protein